MSIKKNCPVPYDQQPINEYYSLKESCFFTWSTLSIYEYLSNVLIIFCTLSILCLPLTFSLISTRQNLLRIFLMNTLVANFLLFFVFVRLYLGWSYVVKRLVSATVFYEESGWYDGQIWIKTIENLTQDRLIGTYEVIPLVYRIQYSLTISFICFTIESVIYNLL
uniref:Ycf36 n=1 Tax=Pterocladia lucida TaxID=31408 RepID=A0A6M3WW61_PTELU|nr:Ycf36 [Pterocladia lucida]